MSVQNIMEGVSHLIHAAIRIEKEKVIYIDPFRIDGEPHDADIIFCTHDHFDHLSPKDIEKVKKEGNQTTLVVPLKKAKKFKKYDLKEVLPVEPNNRYEADGIVFETVPSYNIDKKFHKKKENHVGFLLNLKDAVYYIAGDTDYIPEMETVKADVVFLPVGGTYTANAGEAAKAANKIAPKVAVPIHFGSVVGNINDAREFIENLNDDINGVILLK
jgi:L-ascorbate metabolism protein UlaG (beta-lactamase superfamily)